MNLKPANVEAFAWASYFETGFDEVDAQHGKLVGLVNALGERLTRGQSLHPAELEHVLGGLRKYATLHFATEEQMMVRLGIDRRHLEAHCRAHAEFVEQIDLLAEAAHRPDSSGLAELLRYISSWLAFHILGIDMSMARQLRVIERGASAAEAFEREAREVDPANAALVNAVHTLYATVAERNAELIRAKDELERRVAERTADLRKALDQLQAAKEERVHAEKMVALAQFAAGTAHELNTPLGYIGANLNALEDYCSRLIKLSDTAGSLLAEGPHDDAWQSACRQADRNFIREDVPALLTESRVGLARIQRIVGALRRTAAAGAEPSTRCDLGALTNQCIARLRPTLPGNVVIEQLAEGGAPVLAAPEVLAEAISEVLDNAIKAVAGRGGAVRCRMGHEHDQVWLEIADNGPGVDPAIAPRIFEPFFTTRPVGSGTGLGLYLAYQTALRHGGQLKLCDTPSGAVFRFSLPEAA